MACEGIPFKYWKNFYLLSQILNRIMILTEKMFNIELISQYNKVCLQARNIHSIVT